MALLFNMVLKGVLNEGDTTPWKGSVLEMCKGTFDYDYVAFSGRGQGCYIWCKTVVSPSK